MTARGRALERLQEGLALVYRRQRGGHAAEALVGAGAVALWARALTGSEASVWFAIALGVCWYLWRDVTVVQARAVALSAIARWLDLSLPALEDSSTLLLASELHGLGALQRDRVATRVLRLDRDQLARALPMPRQRVLPAFALVGLLGAVLLALPTTLGPSSSSPSSTVQGGRPVLAGVTLEVIPPAYTQLAAFTDETREVEVPEGARLRWEVLTEGAPGGVVLSFDDGARVALTRQDGERWRSPQRTAASSVYRVLAERPWTSDERYRLIRVNPDRAPQFEFAAPTRTITELSGLEAQPTFTIDATVRDDYGLRQVLARLTLASGGGENVRFREQRVALQAMNGETRKERRYRHLFDLNELAMEPGDELYLHLEAQDNRQPAANLATSRTWIVRWPGESYGEQDDAGVMAMRVMPEYFRSQRQIIIDTQALLAAADELTAEAFAGRAQAIAFDQKALRLRYGTFLGEESVTDIGPGVMPDEDDPPVHFPGDGHDHGEGADGFGARGAPTFGQLDAVLEQFGHTHDVAEQATLFDPQTRDLLKAALAQMWDAELQLRLAVADEALPFEYAALDLIKRVQQRSRIYLRRVGFRTTPPDEGRRFSGELPVLALGGDVRFVTPPQEVALARRGLTALAHVSTGQGPAVPGSLLDELHELLQAHPDERSELLNAIGALEALRTAPACERCATELAQGLLRLVPRPLPPAQAKAAPRDTVARAYQRAQPERRP